MVHSSRFKLWFERELSTRTGYDIGIGDVRFGLPFIVSGSAVTVAKSGDVILTAARLALTLNPLELFSNTIQRVRLERPVIYLDLGKILKGSSQTSLPVGIRHLDIRDGTVVLNTSERKKVEFSSINLRAQNLNLGHSSGISLTADVPWLNGKAELFIEQQNDEMKADVVLRQQSSDLRFPFADANKKAQESLRLQAKITRPLNAEANLAVTGKFDQLKIGPKPLTGSLDARLVSNADFTEATLESRVEIADFHNVVGQTIINAPDDAAVATLTGSYSAASKLLSISAFKLNTPLGTAEAKGTLSIDGDPIARNAQVLLANFPWQAIKSYLPEPLNGWNYHGTGRAELLVNGPWKSLQITGVVRGDGLKLQGVNFSVTDVALHAPVIWNHSSLQLKNISLSGKSFSLSANDRLKTGAEQVQIDGSLVYKAEEPLMANGRVQIVGGRFASADGTKVGEKLVLSGSADLIANSTSRPARLTGKLSLQQGEILWDKFFADVAGQRTVLDFDGNYLRNANSLQLHRARLTLASTGSINITGTIKQLARAPSIDINVHSQDFNAGSFFDFFVQQTFKRQYPILDKLSVGGQIGFQLHARGNWEQLTTEGRLSLQGGELRGKSGDWEIGSVALTLPFQLSYPERLNAASRAPPGILSIRVGRFGSHSLEPITSALSLSNNSLSFHQPLRLAIFGGKIEISNLAWPDIINEPKAMAFALEIQRLQLQELTEALGWHHFSGTISGAIPQIRSAGDTLRSEGQIHSDLFGGQLQISEMEIENPFSAIPSIKLAARFQNVRLEQVSQTFAFGKISGILEGVVSDLVIADGQPARFQAQIETVERPGSNQWISVEALNKITILSSGEDSNVLYGGLAGFFENFRYSKMGFKANLRNDRLVLRGVESRDGKEFLVVGTLLPPTVNIISHTQEIGFSELLRRLERIESNQAVVK
jgi:hypothetical protein